VEVRVNRKHFRRLATVSAAAALSLQLLAGAASAAVPTATSDGSSLGNFAGDGWAGFSMSYDYHDSSTLSKLYLEIDISGASAIQQFDITRTGANVARSCAQSPTVITCSFKTVRNGEHFQIQLVLNPSVTASEVRLTGGWSASGFVLGGNNSHGDSWDLCQADNATHGCDVFVDPKLNELVSSRIGDADDAAGFGNLSLTTNTNFGLNKQTAKLVDLPGGQYASVDDNAGGDATGFSWISISVNGGAPLPADGTFQLVIVYPKGTSAPKSFQHYNTENVLTDTYLLCAKGATKINCFDWSNKTNTATLYLHHNGSIRRSG